MTRPGFPSPAVEDGHLPDTRVTGEHRSGERVADKAVPDKRIPVYLITGFLGSGKTTLLKNWLGEPLLADAITVVNEYGEVGLDDRLLATATDLPNMVAGGCVCCTGLAGLAETLEDLFWARLHREIKQFSCVVIETTGLAQPQPIADSFAGNALLRERFVLKATFTTVAATAGQAILEEHESSRAQLEGADVVVITKTDLAPASDADALATAVLAIHPGVPILRSARGDLLFAQALAGGVGAVDEQPDEHSHVDEPVHEHGGHAHHDHHDHDHGHDHHDHDHLDGVTSLFVPADHPFDDGQVVALVNQLRSTYGKTLLRAKGILALADGSHAVLQLSPNESFYDIEPLDVTDASGSTPVELGMTVIVKA